MKSNLKGYTESGLKEAVVTKSVEEEQFENKEVVDVEEVNTCKSEEIEEVKTCKSEDGKPCGCAENEKKDKKEVLYESDEEGEGGSCKSQKTSTEANSSDLVDVEDIGTMVNNFKKSEDDEFDEGFVGEKQAPSNREMITPLLKKSLEKQAPSNREMITPLLKKSL